MQTIITRGHIIEVFNTLTGLLARMPDQEFKFNYAIIKNKRNLEKMAIDIKIETQKMDLENRDLCVKYSKKDEHDKPIVENNKYVIEDQEAFDKLMEELSTKRKDFLEEELEIEGYAIPPDTIPPKMNGSFQEAIMYFIEKPPVDETEKLESTTKTGKHKN